MDRIIFFGNGPVAAASLAFLLQHFNVEAVITKPYPAHHKGEVPVIDLIRDKNIANYQVANKRELSGLIAAKKFTSRVGVIVDFGLIVNQDVIDAFELGIINSHFSLLPEWRGADPITFSVLSGQKTTGVSLMKLVEALDEGDLLAQEPIDISPEDTTGSLTDKLVNVSNQMLLEYLPRYITGELNPYPQDSSQPATYSRKIDKSESVIDWSKPATQIECQIRAFQPWPKSRTLINGKDTVLTKAHVAPSDKYQVASSKFGSLFKTDDKKIGVVTGRDILVIDELVPAGKKPMPSAAYLAGYALPDMIG